MIDIATFPIYDKARIFSKEQHDRTGVLYDGQPYFEGHIEGVLEIGKKYLYLIPPEFRDDKMASLSCHDVVEDTGVTFNDVKNATNERVARWVISLTTDVRCESRAERHSPEYYGRIKKAQAEWEKLCDRIFNVKNSKEKGHSMFLKYKKEQPEFKKNLQHDFTYAEMWHELDSLFYTEDEMMDKGIKEYSLIESARKPGVFVVIELHVKFEKHSSPRGRYPQTYFVCADVKEFLKAKTKEEEYDLTVIRAEDAIMHI